MRSFQRCRSVSDRWSIVRLTLVLLFMSQRHIRLALSHDKAGASSCTAWPPRCSHVCSEAPINTKCSCETGFYLASDERHCHANLSTSGFQPTGRSAYLLYNSGVNIMAIAFDSILSASASSPSSSSSSSSSSANLTPTTIYEGTSQIEIVNFAMALEISKGRIFFGNGDELVVRMVELESRTSSDFLMNGLILVSSMALDWLTSVLYVSDAGLHKIFACSTSKGQCSEIINVHLAFSMDIDAINGKLYWSECSFSGRIEWSYLDGSGRQTVRPADSCPRSLKLDHPTQTLYWVNFADDQIHMHDLSTGELRVLPSSEFIYSLSSVAVFEDDLIWTTSMVHYYVDDREQELTTIHNADKFNRSEILEHPNIIVENLPNAPFTLQVWHSAMQVPGSNPCVEKQCSHLCLQCMAPGVAKCVCPSGMVLQDDQRSCAINWSMPSIVFVKRNELHFVGIDFVGGEAGEVFFKVGDMETITALAFDYSEKTIYLSASNAKVIETADDDRHQAQGMIMRIDLDEHPYRCEVMYSTTSTVTDVEVDWLSKNIYWVDYDAGTIEIASMDGLSQAVLAGDSGSGVTEKPRAIAVDPREKRLFYSDCGRNPHLGSCDLAGLHCKSTSLKKGECATDLFLDHTSRKLYFVLGNRIMVTNIGLDQPVVHRHSRRPNSLATLMTHLYWTDDSDIKFTVDGIDINDGRIRVGENQTGLLGPLIVFSGPAQPEGENRCSSDGGGGCSDICIENKSGNVTCLCQTGNSLNADGMTCNGDTIRLRQALKRIQRKPGPFSDVVRHDTPHVVSVSPSFRGILTSIALHDVSATFVPCPCRNGGTCEIGNGFVKCQCPSGFVGGFCEERVESSALSRSQSFERNFLIYVGAALGAMAIVIACMVAIMCVVKQRSRSSSGSHRDDEVQIKPSENSYEMGCVDDSTSGKKRVTKQKK